MTPRQGTADRRREIYRDAVVLIAREYASDLQIDGVARSIASSRRQLQRVLAEVGNTSFRELIASARMHEARKLLVDTDVPIQEIALRVGYHQSAQFSKSFRQHFGVAPRTYRRSNAGANPRGGRVAASVPPVAQPSTGEREWTNSRCGKPRGGAFGHCANADGALRLHQSAGGQ